MNASADRLITLFNEAKAIPAGEQRQQFLGTACQNDAQLHERVASLLAADESAGDFLKPARLDPFERIIAEQPGDRIGRYKLLEKIGEGGCGVVYIAEQEEPVRRRVAVKVIKLGMDTRQVVARFEAERQTLALMEHVNIARVFDAGATETGRPYFVMELVRGVRITDYCEQQNLRIEERLALFAQVCQAIEHAHQKGIIHRDIKPSNVLVTVNDGVAVPKVIDFGIAKATEQRLTERTVFTFFEQFIGTPAYMSPEQAEMTSADIDTRSDIYSLGVLLYELLTGRTPFSSQELAAAGEQEARRIIGEAEPRKPSAQLGGLNPAELKTVAVNRQTEAPHLIHRIRGDLDWIVMKCLEKDRARRYETASGLAAEVRRHLAHEPVTASPPSNLYRLGKLARRNRVAVGAVAAVSLALVLGIVVSSSQAFRARRAEQAQIILRKEAEAEKQKAQKEGTRSRQVAHFMKDMLNGVGPAVALGRDTGMLREILDKTAERIAEDLKDQPEVQAELRNTIGGVYWQLGDFNKATPMLQQAVAVQRTLLGNEHASVADSLHNLAQTLRYQGKLIESEAAFRESLAIRRKLLGDEHAAVVDSLNRLGSLLSIQLKDAEPEALLREAVATGRKIFGNDHWALGESLDNLAHVLRRQDNLEEAAAMHFEAFEIRKKAFGNTHPELLYSFINLGDVLKSQGKLADAEAMVREALALSQRLLGQQHPQFPLLRLKLAEVLRAQGKPEAEERSGKPEPPQSPRTVASSKNPDAAKALQEQAVLLIDQGKPLEAEPLFRQAVGLLTDLVQNNPARDNLPQTLGHAQWKLGQLLGDLGRHNEAEKIFLESLRVFEQAARDFPSNPFFRQEQAFSHRHLGRETNALGRIADAEGHYREAAKLYAALAAEAPQIALYRRDESYALSMLAPLLHRQGKLAELEIVHREQLARRKEQFGEVHREVAVGLGSLAQVLQDQRKFAESESVWREELAVEKKLSGEEHPFVANSLISLSHTLTNQNELAEAEAVVREALVIRKKLLGNEHPDVAAALAELGAILLRQQKYAEAEPLLISGYEGMKERADKTPAGSKHHFKATLQRLVQLYGCTGQTEKAAEWARKLEEFGTAEADRKTAAPSL